MTLSINEATRFINVIDYRIAKSLGRGTVVERTYGDVNAVSGTTASVFIGGDINASEGFRIPSGLHVETGDRVRVTIDPRGYRYIEEVLAPTTVSKLESDPVRGRILLGDGTNPPDTTISRSAPGTVSVDGDVVIEGTAIIGPDGIKLTSGWGGSAGLTDGLGNAAQLNAKGLKLSGDYGNPDPPAAGIQFGLDANLYRDGGDSLRTDDNFYALGRIQTAQDLRIGTNEEVIFEPASGALGVVMPVGEAARWYVRSLLLSTSYGDPVPNDYGIQFGPDTNLYRSSPDVLATDDNLLVAAALFFGASADVKLYRAAADRLKTDDHFDVAGDLKVFGQPYGNTGVLPWAMYATTVSVSVSGANGFTTVNFPAGRFTQPPMVFVTQASLPGSSGKFIGKVNSGVTTTSASIYAYTGDGTSVTSSAVFNVLAIQMTSGASAG